MAETHALRHLDSKVKLVWFIPSAALLFCLWLAILLALFVGGIESPLADHSRPAFALLSLLFLLIFVAGPVYAYYHIEYLSFTYELAPKEIVIRQGVFTRETTLIPYERIQNINTRRTLLERLLGLASLGIDTAGTNPNMAEGVLPGVSKKDQLIREIMDRVERAKSGRENGLRPAAWAGADLPSERQLLADILKELVQLKHLLQQQRESASPARPPAPPLAHHSIGGHSPPPAHRGAGPSGSGKPALPGS